MGTIVQTGIGLEIETLARCDRLRAVFGRSRSWVIERALTGGGLTALEDQKMREIDHFNAMAWDLGGAGWQEYARRYVEAFGAKTYPPTVAILAAMKFTGTETSKQVARKLLKVAAEERVARRAAADAHVDAGIERDLSALPSEGASGAAVPEEVPPQPRRASLRDFL